MVKPSYVIEGKANEEKMKELFKIANEKEYVKEEDEEALKEMMDYSDMYNKLLKVGGSEMPVFRAQVNFSTHQL